MVSRTVLYLSRQDVVTVNIPMVDIIGTLERMFREKGAGKVEMPPKPGIHPRSDATMHAMAAYIPALESAGVKWVSGYPGNPEKGLPYVTGLLILNDCETGVPVAVMDCTWITAQRTGAATAVAAKYLARPDSARVGILACGTQGRSNLEALACLFPIETVKAYDLVPEIARRYASEMGARLDVQVESVETPADAVRGMDIVVTSGPILRHPERTIEAGWLSRGAFASAVDYDCYWRREALREIDKLATDDLAQMAYYRKLGYFEASPEPYADLGEIVAGRKPGRQSAEERTMAMNLGLALDDMAVAPHVYRKALDLGIGTQLPL